MMKIADRPQKMFLVVMRLFGAFAALLLAFLIGGLAAGVGGAQLSPADAAASAV